MHIAALHQPSQVQLNQQGNLKHFLTIEGLSKESLTKILDTAQSFLDDNNNLINRPLLEGLTVMNLFFENSTRTRTTFEAAAKRLSANVLNIDIARSSTSKGETLSFIIPFEGDFLLNSAIIPLLVFKDSFNEYVFLPKNAESFNC